MRFERTMLAVSVWVVAMGAASGKPPHPHRLPSPVAKTGQTECWGSSGTPISCAGTGQDGEYQSGASVDPRFTDNGDGTVTDNLTGLIWLQYAGCGPKGQWGAALNFANQLSDGSCGLSDGSVAGDWRLPNIREIQSLINFGANGPALPSGHPFQVVQLTDFYWSSTTHQGNPMAAWVLIFTDGTSAPLHKTQGVGFSWAVRSGP